MAMEVNSSGESIRLHGRPLVGMQHIDVLVEIIWRTARESGNASGCEGEFPSLAHHQTYDRTDESQIHCGNEGIEPRACSTRFLSSNRAVLVRILDD